jgi:DNA (cytosine-5)-methyltransferase 1
MSLPVLFDLFSGAGGAGMGYSRAGFRVIGVDIKPMPRYPGEFVQADAMQVLRCLADGAEPWPGAPYPAAVHVSQPCQRRSRMTNCRPGLAAAYPDLVGPVHELLTAWGGPWIIENVEDAGLPGQDDLFGAHGVMLCGTMFGLELYRHRWFQASFPLHAPGHPRHLKPASKAGHWEPGTVISVEGHFSPIELGREAMGIGWMTREELAESIPPAYAEYLGAFLLEQVAARSAA